MQYSKILILGAFFLSLITFPQNLPKTFKGKDVSSILCAMPKRDRERLEYFFRELVAWDTFGYVLFGNKPMAIGGMAKIHPFMSFAAFKQSISPRRMKFDQGLATWKKYETYFPIFQFEILYEGEFILLIHKKNFIKTIKGHLDDFRLVLNREINADDILNETKERPLMSGILMNHDGLIGTLLGYGRNNAFLFYNRSQLDSDQEKIDFCNWNGLTSAWTDEEFGEFCEKFQSVSWISEYITGSHLKDLELMALPGFLAQFDSVETQALRRQYLETKRAIIEHYKGKDFLEETLKILTAPTAKRRSAFGQVPC